MFYVLFSDAVASLNIFKGNPPICTLFKESFQLAHLNFPKHLASPVPWPSIGYTSAKSTQKKRKQFTKATYYNMIPINIDIRIK